MLLSCLAYCIVTWGFGIGFGFGVGYGFWFGGLWVAGLRVVGCADFAVGML